MNLVYIEDQDDRLDHGYVLVQMESRISFSKQQIVVLPGVQEVNSSMEAQIEWLHKQKTEMMPEYIDLRGALVHGIKAAEQTN